MNQKLRILELAMLLAVAAVGCGAPRPIPVTGGKTVLSLPPQRLSNFLKELGFPHNNTADATRSTTGDLLFVQFVDPSYTSPSRKHRVAIVASNGVALKELPGRSQLDDNSDVVFWYDDVQRNLHFAGGSTLPTNIYPCRRIADARFVALYNSNHLWIARSESPLEEIVAIPRELWLEKLVSYGDRLHVFVMGQPEQEPRRDGWPILKRFEYQIEANRARLVQVQDFDFTWSIMDFDPETGLMLAHSWATMWSHGLLVNTRTGSREDLGRNGGYLLKDEVVRRFLQVAQEGQ